MNNEVWNYKQKELTVEELTLLQEALLLHTNSELKQIKVKEYKINY